MKTSALIIVGTGLAGYNLAKEFRKLSPSRELILITEDAGHFYSKPQLSTAIQHKKSPGQLVISTGEDMQQQLNATLYAFSKVTAIDPETQELIVETPSGTVTLHYAQLVLAVGAVPKALPLLDSLPNHFRINNLSDYEHFIKTGAQAKECTIIGSGLVGCEFAHDFCHHIPSVQVVTPDPYPLYNLVPSLIGRALQEALTQKGIEWLTNQPLPLQLNTSSPVVAAIGLSPSIDLAKQANLETKTGIIVNAFLQTSNPHIYALGDCAEINGICRQYIAPLLQCARALAQTLSENPTPVHFPVFAISLKVASYPVVMLPPAKHAVGEWQFESKDTHHKALFLNEHGHVLGYALSGNYLEERQSCLALVQTQQSFA